jgi:hypothetical protein
VGEWEGQREEKRREVSEDGSWEGPRVHILSFMFNYRNRANHTDFHLGYWKTEER